MKFFTFLRLVLEVQAPIAVSIKHQNYGVWQKASSIPVLLCESVIDHPILDILTILPFHAAPPRPSSFSVPIYPPFRRRNQFTFLLPPSLGTLAFNSFWSPS